MGVKGIDHVVIAVKDLGKAEKFFSKLLGIEFDELGENKQWKFKSVISPEGFELLTPTTPDSETAKYIKKRGEGYFAVALTMKKKEKLTED
ncbi:hypothetical protein CW703_04190 [Candidatus Bathyarchaeota archaeon]|nr:MAG: hypothetical protein CW703_04190 [Candidatus Bathyarchaeota archaeon]